MAYLTPTKIIYYNSDYAQFKSSTNDAFGGAEMLADNTSNF